MTQPRSCDGMTTDEMVKDIWQGLYGDHSENRPGLILRVDRLEAKQRVLSWAAAASAAAAIPLAVGWAWGKLTGKAP